MKLRPIKNHIVFQFLDDMKRVGNKAAFGETTDWGFEMSGGQQSYDESAKRPRWGIVKYIGHEVDEEEIFPGLAILVEPLKWTKGFSFEGETFWRTDADQVMAVDETISA